MWLGVGVLALPLGAWAQASGESSEMGPGINAQAGGVDAMAARSPLWQSVDAMHRQRDGAAAQDRRLSAEERQQLREQIRRASIRLDGETQLRNTHLGQR